MHPGGKFALLHVAGKDCTRDFYELHRDSVIQRYQKLRVGSVRRKGGRKQNAMFDMLPQIVPYTESPSEFGLPSPYFTESHIQFRKVVRAWLEENVVPTLLLHEESGKYFPLEMYKKMGEFGLLTCRLGPGKALNIFPNPLPANVSKDAFDHFHELIVHEEFARIGCPGANDGLGSGFIIGFPPLLHFASQELLHKYAKPILLGEKRICLAISEAYAGSDVSAIRTTARKTDDGRYYIVNGSKKWITNGDFSDYFTTAVRTSDTGKGYQTISFLLIERSEGVSTKKIQTSYSSCAGTAHIFFDNVKVPVENLLGKENEGFKCIMANFNHERWVICVGIIRTARAILDDCLRWAHQRYVFNKRLIDQPVIRLKFADMVAEIETCYAWLESITYQMCNLNYKLQNIVLSGPIALLKYISTRMAYHVNDHACQIFGGRAITKGGMGANIERFQRAVKYPAILGGSEEIMADLGIRMASKFMPPTARL
uniref:Acyl-CoA dehydrogenase n=1 Tax=Lygus hesperus TaxID=30085 RepID=A0A0A9WYE9_LYGHE